MLAVINYYDHCDFYDLEECESMAKAKTVLLLAGYLPDNSHPLVWRKGHDKTALIIPVDDF